MKRCLCALLTLFLTLSAFTGCSSKEAYKKDDSLQIVATIFPAYDWAKNVLGDNPANAELTMLINNGVDLHSYSPSVDDILTISNCDIFIYVGGESDTWVEDALKEAVNKDMKVINLLKVLGDGAREEELAEGMEGEEEEEDEDGGEEDAEYDEHVWLSLKNAKLFTESICDALVSTDSANADVYKKNAADYEKKLDDLDNEYAAAVSAADKDTLLFADRFPFRYMTEDYGLKYYAAFLGCSAETEASFETITFLAQKTDELSLKNILIIDGSDGNIAESVIAATSSHDQGMLTLDSMQSVTSKNVENGATFLSIMSSNLDVLKDALK